MPLNRRIDLIFFEGILNDLKARFTNSHNVKLQKH